MLFFCKLKYDITFLVLHQIFWDQIASVLRFLLLWSPVSRLKPATTKTSFWICCFCCNLPSNTREWVQNPVHGSRPFHVSILLILSYCCSPFRDALEGARTGWVSWWVKMPSRKSSRNQNDYIASNSVRWSSINYLDLSHNLFKWKLNVVRFMFEQYSRQAHQ